MFAIRITLPLSSCRMLKLQRCNVSSSALVRLRRLTHLIDAQTRLCAARQTRPCASWLQKES